MNARNAAWICSLLGAALLTGCQSETPEPIARNHARSERTVPTPVMPANEIPVSSPVAPPPPPSPQEIASAWSEGVALYDSRDFTGAATKLELAVTGRPDDAYAHYLLGLAEWKAGNPKQAEPALERSGELGQGSIKTWINLARVRLELGEDGSALEAAERALAIDTQSGEAMHQKGRALGELGRTAESIETLLQASAVDPTNGYIANTLGFRLIQAGRESEAIEFLESARDRLPGVAYVRNNLGVAYERTGRTGDAIAEYRAAVEAGDSGGKAVASLGRLGVDSDSTEVTATAMAVP